MARWHAFATEIFDIIVMLSVILLFLIVMESLGSKVSVGLSLLGIYS